MRKKYLIFFVLALVVGVSAFLYMRRKQEVSSPSSLAMIIASNSVMANPEASAGSSSGSNQVTCYSVRKIGSKYCLVECYSCKIVTAGSRPKDKYKEKCTKP